MFRRHIHAFQTFIQINLHSKSSIHIRKLSLVYGLLAVTNTNIENKNKTKHTKKKIQPKNHNCRGLVEYKICRSYFQIILEKGKQSFFFFVSPLLVTIPRDFFLFCFSKPGSEGISVFSVNSCYLFTEIITKPDSSEDLVL